MKMTFEVTKEKPDRVDLVLEGIQGFQHRIDVTDLIDDQPIPGKYPVSCIHIEDGRIAVEREDDA